MGVKPDHIVAVGIAGLDKRLRGMAPGRVAASLDREGQPGQFGLELWASNPDRPYQLKGIEPVSRVGPSQAESGPQR